jgi:hypothetical protein
MRRDLLLLAEMIDAAEQAQHLVDGVTITSHQGPRCPRVRKIANIVDQASRHT